jgi:hypothetical protein
MFNANLQQFARAVGCTRRTKHGQGTIARGGGATSAEQVKRYLPSGFAEMADFRDGYLRAVWVSFTDLAIVTYCEGDVTIERLPNEDAYLDEIQRQSAYYARLAQ